MIEYLVVHHTATGRDTTVQQIRDYHQLHNRWRDIGYQQLIRQPTDDAPVRIVQGRPEDGDLDWERDEYGAHTKGHNHDSYGVALIGDFTNEDPPAAMLDVLVALLVVLCARWGLAPELAIRGHRHMPGAKTACPGFNDELLEQVRQRVARQLGLLA